jgi:hypothetical protein
MASHPVNLAIRFFLEVAALIVFGMWGSNYSNDWLGIVLMIGLPLIAATCWGVFNVPGDPSRSGNAPIIVPGIVRLLIELLFFTAAILALYAMGYPRLSLLMGSVVAIHYLVSYDRLAWLLKQ